MSKKHFESEISKSLTALPHCYFYKPIDIMQSGTDKVDFLVCYHGKFFAIEVKEVKGQSCPASEFSDGQNRCLRSVMDSGGLAVVLVNFGRKPLSHDTGKVFGWWGWPLPFPLRPEYHPREIPRISGGWNLAPWLNELSMLEQM